MLFDYNIIPLTGIIDNEFERGIQKKELKARDPMRWVGLMNTLKAQVEELILSELIFS